MNTSWQIQAFVPAFDMANEGISNLVLKNEGLLKVSGIWKTAQPDLLKFD